MTCILGCKYIFGAEDFNFISEEIYQFEDETSRKTKVRISRHAVGML